MLDPSEFNRRCEWGEAGIQQLAPISQVVVIVDVLSFSTAVEIATRRGAIVLPYRWRDATAEDFARSHNAVLAGTKRGTGYTLSPSSLRTIPPGFRLVLPSPNGAALSLATGQTLTIAGCLRNARAVAEFAQQQGGAIAVVPAGERWEDGSLRPALEDWLGAGAILSELEGERSPEAEAAVALFQRFESNLLETLRSCSSGRELIDRGFAEDVELAASLNVSRSVPVLRDGAYQAVNASVRRFSND